MNQNLKLYDNPLYVSLWTNHCDLQAPEQSIYSILKDNLSEYSMLDIGVGAGRTTLHFAPYVKNYLGVDWSINMINSCNTRFKHLLSKSLLFENLDARSMDKYGNSSFDFILFSYNGIDSVVYHERAVVFSEILRVLKGNGFFCFSTHNINSINLHYKFRNPGIFKIKRLAKEIYRFLGIQFYNGSRKKIGGLDYKLFKDGVYKFKLVNDYINLEHQYNQLQSLGFKNLRCFALSGKEINSCDLKNTTDYWIYFLCQK